MKGCGWAECQHGQASKIASAPAPPRPSGRGTHQEAALDVAAAHVRNELQRAPQLLPRTAQRDHGGVRVAVAEALQGMPLRQAAHPVKELPRPAAAHDQICRASPACHRVCRPMTIHRGAGWCSDRFIQQNLSVKQFMAFAVIWVPKSCFAIPCAVSSSSCSPECSHQVFGWTNLKA